MPSKSFTFPGSSDPVSAAAESLPVAYSVVSLPIYSAVAVPRFAYAAYNSGRVPRSVHPAEHRFSTAGAAAPVARAQSYPANVVFLPERTLHPAETGQAAQWLLFASFPRSEC